MKRILPLMVSAVLCGILIMFLPLYVWHRANFPNEPVTLSNLRGESLEYFKAQWALMEPTQTVPFYMSLAVSFAISIIAYACLKRRL